MELSDELQFLYAGIRVHKCISNKKFYHKRNWEAVNVLILKINIRRVVKNDNYSLTYFMDFTTFRMQNQKGNISMYNCTILSIAKINN